MVSLSSKHEKTEEEWRKRFGLTTHGELLYSLFLSLLCLAFFSCAFCGILSLGLHVCGLSRVWEQVYLEGGRARINHFVLPLVGLHKPVFFFQLVFFFFVSIFLL
jgi:hypothetical protein